MFDTLKRIFKKQFQFNFKENFWSFTGSFIGLAIIAGIQSLYLPELENVLMIGAFGASCVLIFGAVDSPLTQPRNFIGGQVISGLIGVTVFKFLPDIIWITAPLAVALSIVVMQMTKTLHPPGGATALIAVIGTEKIKTMGYSFVLSPVLTGTVILFLTALIINNLGAKRKYPHDNSLT